ncbi:MAG: glycosyltransferase family 4 protein [Bacillota bacterium]|nr:glycosyltransferase family 4 protein [Bacillota bacterium]
MKVLLTATVQSHICQFHKPLVEVLHKHGCKVHVAAKDNLAEKNGLKLDFVEQVFDVPFSRSPKSLDNVKAYKELKKILEQEDYDIIHCNTPMGGIVTRLAARKMRAKVIYTAHGFHFYQGAPKKNWLVFYPIERLFAKITDTLITITHEDYDLASKKFSCKVAHMHGVGVDEKRYTFVTEEEKKQLKMQYGYSPDQPILLCVGELNKNKNQTMAIFAMKEVIKEYKNAQLLLAGNGPEEEHLRQVIRQQGLENNVKLLGYVTNLQDYQHITDISLSCSKREGLPLNIVEAMLSGSPVVASINRGHRELIHTRENGFLVEVNDSHGMAKRILSLLNNPDLYDRIQENARVYAKAYGFKNVKKELEEIYFGSNTNKK